MRKTWVLSQGWKDPLEKEMATHSSTLAWKIPWMEEPGGLQSMGSQSWTQLSDFTFTLFSIFLPRMGIAGSFGGFPPPTFFYSHHLQHLLFWAFWCWPFGKFILRFINMLLVYSSIDLIADCSSVHSPNDEHLNYCQVGTIVHKAAVKIKMQKIYRL